MSSRSGLPSGPGQRSRSVARSRDDDRDRDRDRNRSRYDDDRDTPRPSRSRYDDDDRDARPSARQIRPQKSMGSIKQGRSGSQPPPPMPSSRSRHNARPSYDTRSESNNNRSSDSTTSSGSSSFFDRMRGYASSRTSFEDEEPEKPAPRSLRSRRARDESPPSPEEEIAPGEGHSLWGQIASAASSLTVNVSKAWASNVTTFAGEETPVGQESRLTRAMKAYHLEKARDPSDLPSWLFDEKERRKPAAESSSSSRSRRRGDSYDDDYEERKPATRADAPAPSRGLRDIYDAAAASSSTSTPSGRSNRGARSYADDSPQPSKATDRLKALRDAKRSAVNPNVVRDEEQARSAARVEREREREPVVEAPRRKVGLPSGPVSRR